MTDKKREYLRQEIMLQIKANNLPVTGDVWISLIFASDQALIGMAQELGVKRYESTRV